MEFMEELVALERDKGVPADVILEALANALVSAYKRTPGAAEEARVTIDPDTAEITVYGQELDEDGNVVDEWEDTPDDFGRIAAQTAKQVIVQRLRDAKRAQVFDIYEGREGDLVTGIVQQSDHRYIILDLGNAEEVRAAFETMWRRVGEALPEADISGLLVRPMIPGGYEVILGAKRDPAFGPNMTVGLGGIYVGLFKDVTFGLAPLDRHTAARMVRQVKACRLLEGARGGVCSDIEGIQECLVRVGQLISDFDRILELDVNPLIAGPASVGNMVADVRIRLAGA